MSWNLETLGFGKIRVILLAENAVTFYTPCLLLREKRAPRGILSLKNFELYATLRLKFLLRVLKCGNEAEFLSVLTDKNIVAASDVLLEGSHKDAISHYTLRLLLASEPDACNVITEAEIKLFQFRLLCMTDTELAEFLSYTEKRLDKLQKSTYETFPEYKLVYYIQSILSQVKSPVRSWKKAVFQSRENKCQLLFSVPFTVVPHLVANRIVSLQNGRAYVPYKHLQDVLKHCFELNLLHGVQLYQSKHRYLDKRCRILRHRLMVLVHNQMRSPEASSLVDPLWREKVQVESLFFPPCMSALLQSLQTHHQLHHHARIQLTLFLKEIGMPIEEAVQFWKQYYSKASEVGGCGPKWVGNEKRYTYSIRHLYGLEGSRINYRAHCCNSLQEFIPPCGSSGGCPFKHFDDSALTRLLTNEKIPNQKDFLELRNQNQFSFACSLYMKRKGELAQKQNLIVPSSTEVIHRAKKPRLKDTCTDYQGPHMKPGICKVDSQKIQCTFRVQGSKDAQSEENLLRSTAKTGMNSLVFKRAQDSEIQQNLGKDQRELNRRNRCEDTPIGKEFKTSRETSVILTKHHICCEDSNIIVGLENSNSSTQRETVVESKLLKSGDCFCHDLCLSQIVDEEQLSIVTQDIRPTVKPSEFYMSYKRLCNTLKI